jgi:hypothetical protein
MNDSRRVDMSSKGIDRRLREVGQLYRLGISLGKAKPLVGAPVARPDREELAADKAGDGT